MMVKKTSRVERTPARDVELVREYLEQFPRLHINTLKEFNPSDQRTKYEWDAFLSEDWDYKMQIFKSAGNANIEGLHKVSLRDLTIKHVGEPIELEECSITAISVNRPIAEWLRYKCLTCGEDTFPLIPNQMSSAPRPKMKCCDSQVLIEVFDKRDMVDAQWVRLQEVKRNNKISKVPLNIPALMKGEEMLWSLSFNERIRPKGLLRFRVTKSKTDGTKQYIPWFEMFAFTRVKAEDIFLDGGRLSEADVKNIESEMRKPGFFAKVLKSFAPHIYGMEVLKEAALLTLGSVRHSRPVRVLIVGDPSLAKSMVMEYASMLLPESFYVVMSDSRKTGLTTTSVQDPITNEWMVEPGVFALADGSAMFIDEFQQGKPEDIGGLNHVIERGKIQYSLAGGNHGEFDANCAIMISCNAHTGMIGSEENIYELLKFIGRGVPSFVGRMSLVLFLKDEKTQEEEEEVAGRIYDHSESDPLAKYKQNWPDPRDREEITVNTPFKGLKMTFRLPEERYGTTMLRKILRYIIEYVPIHPMPPEFRDSFIKYYMDKRADVVERHNKLITPRFMRHMVNLTQVYARLHGRSQATREDMEHIFTLMLKHMAVTTPIDPETGEYDVNIYNGSLPKATLQQQEEEEVARMNKMEQWEYGCRKAMKVSEDGEWFTEQALVNILAGLKNSKWTDMWNITNHIDKFMTAGKMMQNKDRKYTWLNRAKDMQQA